MQSILEFLHLVKEFLNPKFIIDTMLDKLGVFVYFGLFFIIFAETGLAVGFFLPGDSLLVVAGLFAAAGKMNIFVLLVSLFVAGILGDLVGYLTGRRMGKTVFSRPKSRVFNPNHLVKAQKFYEKYGGKTIILARFVPVVRTFAPIVAGAANMPYRNFAFYNILGSFLWIFSMLLAGYFLGGAVEQLARSLFGVQDFKLEDHIDKVVIVVVLLSILPIIVEYIKARREPKTPDAEAAAGTQI